MSSDIHALSGAYAVDALDDAERADFERHLAVCEACREEVADLQAAATEIAASTAQVPPPSLRASVLAGIADVRPLPPVPVEPEATPGDLLGILPGGVEGGVAGDVAGGVPSNLPGTFPSNLPSNVRPLRRRLWQQVGLAAAAAAVVAGGTTVVLHPWDRSSVSPPLADPGYQVIHAADAQRYTGQVQGGGTITVYRSVALNRAVVVAKGMSQAPAGHVYELWLLAPTGTMKRGGLFADGSDLTQVVTGNAGPARALGITIEKAGGSDEPTTNPIALVPMTSA